MRIAARLLVILSMVTLAACQESITAPEAPRLDEGMPDLSRAIGHTINAWYGYGPFGFEYRIGLSALGIVDVVAAGTPIEALGVNVTCVAQGTVRITLLRYVETINVGGAPYDVLEVIDEFDLTCL